MKYKIVLRDAEKEGGLGDGVGEVFLVTGTLILVALTLFK